MSLKVCQGRITSRFGRRKDPFTGRWSEHNGVDISAVVGSEVLSPTDGVVEAVYSNPVGGNTLIITCDNHRFGFCHLSYFAVKVGQRVAKGELVARTGNSGRTTGPHLHFSLMVDRVYVDPEQFIEL